MIVEWLPYVLFLLILLSGAYLFAIRPLLRIATEKGKVPLYEEKWAGYSYFSSGHMALARVSIYEGSMVIKTSFSARMYTKETIAAVEKFGISMPLLSKQLKVRARRADGTESTCYIGVRDPNAMLAALRQAGLVA